MNNNSALAVCGSTNKSVGLMNYVLARFQEKGLAAPQLMDLKVVLGLMYDWATGCAGLSYMYALLGVDIVSLADCIIHSTHGLTFCDDMEHQDTVGYGFYLFEKTRPSEYEDRMRNYGELSREEAKSISDWFTSSTRYRSNIKVPRLDPEVMELICWSYITYCLSPEGEDFLWSLDPWGQYVRAIMTDWSLDKTQKPWKWIRKNNQTVDNGAVVMMDIAQVHNCTYEELYGEMQEEDFSDEESKLKYQRIRDTDMIVLDPADIIITGREPGECRFCGAKINCVSSIVNYALPKDFTYEIMSEYIMCWHCKEQKIAEGLMFEDSEHELCYTRRCPSIFLRKMVESDMHVDLAEEVIRNGVKGHFWSRDESPIPNDHFLDQRIAKMKDEEPNKLRHMAAYILMRNPCIASHYSDNPACGRLNHKSLTMWFLTLRQADYEERMRLGTYQHKVGIGA